MSMRVSQEYIEENVINPIARRLAEIEKKIDAVNEKIDLIAIPIDDTPKLAEKPKPVDKPKIILKNIKKVK